MGKKSAAPKGATGAVRNRIRELRQVRAADLVANPLNWRQHGEQQKAAMTGILAEVGIVDALLVTDNGDGTFAIVDGHMRAGLLPDAELPCLVLDLTPEEATKVLLTFDPIAAMAEASAANLNELLRQVEFGDAALQELMAGLADTAGLYNPADLPNAEPESSAAEIDTDEFAMECTCPRCGFEFNPKT